MAVPVGDGLPGWLDTDEYLSGPEVSALPSADISHPEGRDICLYCGKTGPTQKAHVRRKQAGGRKADGPQGRLCFPCHDHLDNQASETLAIRRADLALCYLTHRGAVCRVLARGWL